MMETETTAQQNVDLPKIIPRKLFKQNKTHDINQINTEQVSLVLQVHYKLVSTDDLILKEKQLLWELRCKIQKKGLEIVKNKMLDFIKSINEITYTGQEVISFPQIKKWYSNPQASDLNKQKKIYDIFEHKEIPKMTNELMTTYNLKYVNKYHDKNSTIIVERQRENGWIGVILSRIVKSRRDCVSQIFNYYYVSYLLNNILY